MICGLITSTLFTLLAPPAFYLLVYEVRERDGATRSLAFTTASRTERWEGDEPLSSSRSNGRSAPRIIERSAGWTLEPAAHAGAVGCVGPAERLL